MLDEQTCLDLQEQDSPRIAVSALNHLHRVLSAQPLLQPARGSILPAQEANAENQTTTTASVSTEEMAPGLSPKMRARAIVLLSLLLRETIRKRPSTNKEEGHERQNSTNIRLSVR
jgi:hypothetical protein